MTKRTRPVYLPYDSSAGALWTAALAGTTIAIAVVAIWWVLNERAHQHIDSAIDNSARTNQLLIQHDLDHRLLALGRLAQRWTATGGTPRAVWETDATRYEADMPGFQAIAWADASAHIRWIVPLAGNEVMQDMDISRIAPDRTAGITDQGSSDAELTGPFELAQGGLGIAAYLSVYRDNQFDGSVMGILHLESWLSTVIGGVQNTDYHARILLQDREAYRYDADTDPIDETRTERSEFEMYGMTWTMLITPTSDFLSAGHAESSSLVLIAGLLFSAMVVVAVYLMLIARIRSRMLHDTASQLETLFQNLQGMAYRSSDQPRRPMEFVSEGCRELSGYTREDFEEQRVCWADLIHPDDRESVLRSVQHAITNGGAYEFEYRIITRTKEEKWIWERGRPVSSDGSARIRLEGFISDISRQRSAEAEAGQQREQLAHLDRLGMLGEMASGIAHEINQPLTAISLFAEAGKRLLNTGKQDQLPEVFSKLSQHAHRASAVIERVQAMARRQEGVKEVLDCNALVEEVARLAEADARIRDIVIEVETEKGLPAVNVDVVQIQQVVLNLLRNGMDAMQSVADPADNVITLRTELLGDGDVKVAVVDSGSGVSDAVEKILFTPFSTTKQSGMGMGLSISRAIITAHGGHLDFYNNNANGATFFFTLPAAEHEVEHG